MESKDLWKVMKWAGYVYIPVIITFIVVYIVAQYRLKQIDVARSRVDIVDTGSEKAPEVDSK